MTSEKTRKSAAIRVYGFNHECTNSCGYVGRPENKHSCIRGFLVGSY